MKKLRYSISDSLNRWQITPVVRREYESPYKAFDADINKGEGYVQIIYPVRESFLKERFIEKAQYYSGPFELLYFPFENGRVEKTTFIHRPHYLSFYARTFIEMDERVELPFELFTCGGVKIWVNGKEILTFTPYTRNIASSNTIVLPLERGENEILVFADELAERDVFFYFELRCSGDRPLDIFLPVDYNPDDFTEAEKVLESCYLEKDFYERGEIKINFDSSLLKDTREVIIRSSGIEDSLSDRKVTIEPGCGSFCIGNVSDFKIGAFDLFLSFSVGHYEISRNLFVAVNDACRTTISSGGSISTRKREILSLLSEIGESCVQRTIAIIETKGEMTDDALNSLDMILRQIERKEDCADFSLGTVLLLLDRYSEYLDDAMRERIRKCFLDFRYWIDEPGNDVMWFFSENHALLFHVGQYLAGDYFAEDLFSVSGRTGREQYEIGRQRLIDWFDLFFRYGFAEWNSTSYLPVDLIGFFNLYEMAPDEDIKKMAENALDYTFRIIAGNSFEGVMSSSFGRIYEKTIKGRRELNEVNMLSFISSGKGVPNGKTRAVALYCISSYEPGDCYSDMLLEKGEDMVLQYRQGESGIQTYQYMTREYQMASAIGFKPFVHGHQQQVSVVSLGKKAVQFFVNHPGERAFSGGGRPSYWAGNGTNPLVHQFRNVTMMLTDIEDHELVKYIHAYAPLYDFDTYDCRDNWFFARSGEAYLGAYFSKGYEITESGANTGKELISRGTKNGVLIKTGSICEFGSFDSFIKICMESEIRYREDQGISCKDSQYGKMELGYSGVFLVDGNEVERENTYNPEPEKSKTKCLSNQRGTRL